MADHRKEIPTWALINTLVLHKAICTDDFARCVREVEEEFKVAPGAFKIACRNFADTVGFLYCLIVVPKEVWLLNENHAIYASFDKNWLLSLFKVEMAEDRFSSHPVYYLIHHLRNAIAHARFSIADDETFTFWDQRPGGEVYFRASASFDSFVKFLVEVGRRFADLRLGLTNG